MTGCKTLLDTASTGAGRVHQTMSPCSGTPCLAAMLVGVMPHKVWPAQGRVWDSSVTQLSRSQTIPDWMSLFDSGEQQMAAAPALG